MIKSWWAGVAFCGKNKNDIDKEYTEFYIRNIYPLKLSIVGEAKTPLLF